ncbi:hypothetical protein TWF730_000296 [Orbilia blumenaviensis]|uniref:3'-5' exonuclease domain-containing protein n=1 Tax=Orbilia blumenaviensis TaxID=1796055 RepID=A0AAV9VND1_9PEZI
MSRRLRTFQVRTATTSIGRPVARCCFHSIIMEDQTFSGSGSGGASGNSNNDGNGSGGVTTTAAGQAGAANTTNNPAKMASPLTTAYPSSSASPSSPFSNPNPSPMTPTTPSNARRLWNPARGIVFAPSPMTPVSPFTPTTPLSRGFKTRSPRKLSVDTPAAGDSSGSTSDIVQSPTITHVRPRNNYVPKPDWADLMNLTSDGKEKEVVPAGFDALQDDILADSATEGPLGEVKSLQDALEATEGETGADTSAFVEEDEGDQYEDPGIQRVKTPEGVEILMWKNAPIVYTEENDPYIPLIYQAAEEVLKAAVKSKSNFDMRHYVNAEGQPPTIHYVTDVNDMEEISKLFENDKAIGFDMEWVMNSFLKPTSSDKEIRTSASVIQISNQERVAIFHLAKFPATTKKFLAPTLKKIIEDPNILKTGVAIKGDMTRLSMVINVSPAGILELSSFHSLIFAAERNELPTGKKLPVSLTALCEEHLKLPLDKGDVRTSNWSRLLNDEQKEYAANDAYASFRIYAALEERRCALDPRPELPPRQAVNHEETIEAYHKRKALAAAKKDDTTPKKPSIIRVPKDAGPQLVKAYDWVKEYAKSKPGGILDTSAANIRCYALWHHQTLDVDDTAAACRDPPLAGTYVAQCILEAILVEKLPYDATRLLWVLRDLSKEASPRFYPLKLEATTRVKEEQVAAKEKAAANSKTAWKHVSLQGWNLDGVESLTERPDSRLVERAKGPAEAFSTRFERKARPKVPESPEISYHLHDSSLAKPNRDSLRHVGKKNGGSSNNTASQIDGANEELPLQGGPGNSFKAGKKGTRTLIRKTGARNNPTESSDEAGTPMKRTRSSPTPTVYRRVSLSSEETKISFSSGELGEVLGGLSETKVRVIEEDALSLRESKSEPNLVPKRPVWIGVPSRRRKDDS